MSHLPLPREHPETILVSTAPDDETTSQDDPPTDWSTEEENVAHLITLEYNFSDDDDASNAPWVTPVNEVANGTFSSTTGSPLRIPTMDDDDFEREDFSLWSQVKTFLCGHVMHHCL